MESFEVRIALCHRLAIGYKRGVMAFRWIQTALVGLVLGLCSVPAWARGVVRPKFVVAVMGHGRGKMDFVGISVHRKARFRITRDGASKAWPRCSADGRHLVYVSGRQVMVVDVNSRRARRRFSSKPWLAAVLPLGLVKADSDHLGRFLSMSPSGRFLVVPAQKGYRLVDLSSRTGRLLSPGSCLAQAGAQSQAVFHVHPVVWDDGGQRFLYLMVTSGPCQGSADRTKTRLQAGVFDVAQARTTACGEVALPPKVRVLAIHGLDAHWSDNDRIACSIDLRVRPADPSVQGRTKRRGVGRGAGSRSPLARPSHRPPRSLSQAPGFMRIHRLFRVQADRLVPVSIPGKPARLIGWKGESLLGISISGRHPVLWRWHRGRSPHRVSRVSRRLGFAAYNATLDTVLLSAPGRKGCQRTRLVKLVRGKGLRALVHWSVWSELLVRDPSGQWGLFRAATLCNHPRPVLYLMRLDGSRLLRELPRRFFVLRHLRSSQVALCPVRH